jgi:hypothetical protein
MLERRATMTDWKNEDDIKAELRAMTDELRRLREGLRNMVSPPKSNPSRAFLHRQSWPPTVEHPPPVAADRTSARKTARTEKSDKPPKPKKSR